MSLQLIEVYIPDKHFNSIDEKLKSFSHHSYWISTESEERKLVRILVESVDVEEILNYLEGISNVADGFETMLIPVKTYISRGTTQKKEIEKDSPNGKKKNENEHSGLLRVSRQELLQSIEKNSHASMNFILLVILSAVVATVGFIKNSEAVVIGAMVIAPMLGPVISMAFSSILGDLKLLVRSSITSLYGISIVVVISIIFSFLFNIGTNTDQFLARTEVTYSDFALALASGAAGSLSFLNRLSGNLVGVMVAVALLPPTVALGLSLGQGMWVAAYGAFLLVTVNVTCILLSAVSIFSISGIRPIKWEEVKRANVSRPLAITFIATIAAILILVIVFGQGIKFE